LDITVRLWIVWVPSTHQRHVIIINTAHGRISVRIKNASFVAPDVVGSDVAFLAIPFRDRCEEGHIILIVEHRLLAI